MKKCSQKNIKVNGFYLFCCIQWIVIWLDFICVLHGLRGTEKLTLSIESCKIYKDIYDSMWHK